MTLICCCSPGSAPMIREMHAGKYTASASGGVRTGSTPRRALGISADHCQKGFLHHATGRADPEEPGNTAHERKPAHILNKMPCRQCQAASRFYQPEILRETRCNAIRKCTVAHTTKPLGQRSRVDIHRARRSATIHPQHRYPAPCTESLHEGRPARHCWLPSPSVAASHARTTIRWRGVSVRSRLGHFGSQ